MIESVLQVIQPISDQIGTGDARGDLTFVIALLLITSGLLLAYYLIFGNRSSESSAKPLNDGFDRFAGLAGRFEKLEMNVNASRTEVIRELQFLHERVAVLEEKLGITSDKTEEISVGPIRADLKESTTQEETHESVEEQESEEFSLEQSTSDLVGRDPNKPAVVVQDDDAGETETLSIPNKELKPVREEFGQKPQTDLSSGLSKTRKGLFGRVKDIFSGRPQISEEALEEVQAFLVSTDLGVKMVRDLTDSLQEQLKRGESVTEDVLLAKLRSQVNARLDAISGGASPIVPTAKTDGPLVVLMVGVNGVGKTTTTAKLAKRWKESGANLLLVAADTFRAAAVQQLKRWGDELSIDVVSGEENSKPSAVVYEAMEKAKAESYDVVLIDTAGRLHTKGNLMQELEGIKNVIQKHQPSAPHEVLLVVDGTTGQNALQQAKEFHDTTSLTGLVVTKLDGTSKGGIVVAIQDELNVPIRYIGIGEGAADLRDFQPEVFAGALFDEDESFSSDEPSEHGKRRRRRREESPIQI